jgi:hypothetical protein
MQWAGKNALPAIHRDFPELAMRRRQQRMELYELLLATDEALFPQRRLRLYVLEHCDRTER